MAVEPGRAASLPGYEVADGQGHVAGPVTLRVGPTAPVKVQAAGFHVDGLPGRAVDQPAALRDDWCLPAGSSRHRPVLRLGGNPRRIAPDARRLKTGSRSKVSPLVPRPGRCAAVPGVPMAGDRGSLRACVARARARSTLSTGTRRGDGRTRKTKIFVHRWGLDRTYLEVRVRDRTRLWRRGVTVTSGGSELLGRSTPARMLVRCLVRPYSAAAGADHHLWWRPVQLREFTVELIADASRSCRARDPDARVPVGHSSKEGNRSRAIRSIPRLPPGAPPQRGRAPAPALGQTHRGATRARQCGDSRRGRNQRQGGRAILGNFSAAGARHALRRPSPELPVKSPTPSPVWRRTLAGPGRSVAS